MAKQKPAPPQKPVFGGKVVCKEGDFEVRVNDQNQACALWTNHGQMFEPSKDGKVSGLENLKAAGILNVHERQLLEFEVIR